MPRRFECLCGARARSRSVLSAGGICLFVVALLIAGAVMPLMAADGGVTQVPGSVARWRTYWHMWPSAKQVFHEFRPAGDVPRPGLLEASTGIDALLPAWRPEWLRQFLPRLPECSIAPSGRQIVWYAGTSAVVCDLKGGAATIHHTGGAEIFDAQISDDGSQWLSVEGQGGRTGLVCRPIHGGRWERRLGSPGKVCVTGPIRGGFTTISASTRLIYSPDVADPNQIVVTIWRWTRKGARVYARHRVARPTACYNWAVAVSPDAKHIVYEVTRDPRGRERRSIRATDRWPIAGLAVYTSAINGGGLRLLATYPPTERITRWPGCPAWLPDSRHVSVASGDRLYILDTKP